MSQENTTPEPSRFDQALSLLLNKSSTTSSAEEQPLPTEEEQPETQETTPVVQDKPVDEDLKLARAQQQYLKYQREALESKNELKKVQEQLKQFESLNTDDPTQIYKFLKNKGITIDKLGKAVLDMPDEPEEDKTSQEVRDLKARLQAMEDERNQRETQRAFEESKTFVSNLLQEEVEKYPALASYSRAPAEIVTRFDKWVEKHGEPEDALAVVHEITQDLHKAVLSDVENIVSSDAALKALLSRPEIRSRALGILGVKQSTGPVSNDEGSKAKGKGALSSIPSTTAADSGNRKTKPQSREELFAAEMAKLKQKLGQ